MVLHSDFPACENSVPAQMLAQVWESISECFGGSTGRVWHSQGLVRGCSQFPTVTTGWEKREKHSQIQHNSQEMSQNTCERSGVRKYKLRVQYFDHITQKNMVIDGMERLGTKNSVILKYFSPMTLWCFRKHFQNWRWNFLVASCCLNIRLRSYLSLSLNSQRFTSGNRLNRCFGQCLRASGTGGRRPGSQRWRHIRALNHRQLTSMEREVVCKHYFMGPPSEKEGVFSISFPNSQFSEICLIFARCQIITFLVNHEWLMINLMTMQSLKFTF